MVFSTAPRTVLSLFRHSQVLALHNQIALGAPELSDTLEQRGQQLRTIEESVLKYISDYESKSPT